MSDIEKKALALMNEVRVEAGLDTLTKHTTGTTYGSGWEALCRAIERHEAFAQEVSDAVEKHQENLPWAVYNDLTRFIIAKPPVDPLVEVVAECDGTLFSKQSDYVEALRAALAARGLEIVERSKGDE